MTKKGLTHIAFVLDETGSMAKIKIKDDTVGGFNAFLEEQKELPGEVHFTLVLFSKTQGEETQRVRHEGVPVADVEPLNDRTYRPRGTTPLLDAVGTTIDSLGARLADTPEEERPENVILAVLTDGLENASREYSRRRVKQMIEHQREKYAWTVIFLGVGIDAFAEARSIGVDPQHTSSFDRSPKGVAESYHTASRTIADVTSGGGGE